jgi:hypothetical protein
VAIVVIKRCRGDNRLKLTLWLIGLFFLTIAIPLYLEMYAIVMTWAAQAAVLAWVGYKYRSGATQIVAFIVLFLSSIKLIGELPLHDQTFRLVLNSGFLSWGAVAIVLYLFHLIYRQEGHVKEFRSQELPQVLFALAIGVLSVGILQESWLHLDLNRNLPEVFIYSGFCKILVLVVTAAIVLLAWKPVCPNGAICRGLAMSTAVAGTLITVVTFFKCIHPTSFTIFFNLGFFVGLVFVAGLIINAIFAHRELKSAPENDFGSQSFTTYALLGTVTLWVLLTEETYLYWNLKPVALDQDGNFKLMGQMYISVLWAIYAAVLMAIGYVRRIGPLRLLAIGYFALTLIKVFLFDLSYLEHIYRIAGFAVLGFLLIGVSFLYQHGRKKGFFTNG